jgi:carbonic anhydrase
MTTVDEFLTANASYASTFKKGDLPMPPARKVAVLTCMDARIDPARALGLEEGDAHVIRNAGGRAADASNIDFLPFSNLEQSVRDDIAFLRASSLIPESIEITGFIYDVRTGKLLSVD